MSSLRRFSRLLLVFSVALFAARGLLAGSAGQVDSTLPPLAADAIVKTFRPGESSPRVSRPQEFGLADEGITMINYTDFFPQNSTIAFASDTVTSGSRWATSGGTTLYATLRGIPNGARITEVLFNFDDNSVASDFTGGFAEYHADASSGANPAAATLIQLGSSGSPGSSEIHTDTSIPIRYQQDVDSDGTIETVNYVLYAIVPAFDGSIRIRSARLLWRRTISPAPVIPTFLDVPPTHPFYDHIEALFDSGITAGCSASPMMFCPGRNVTRGELAVFLAKALGLNWPAFSGP